MVESTSKVQQQWEGILKMFTESAKKIGFPTDEYDFHNAYDPEHEKWNSEVPQPVAAVLFLYLIKK